MPTLRSPDITVFSKSPWLPSIRREHAWAQQAAASGRRVRFLERPLHAKNAGVLRIALGRGTRRTVADGIEAVSTATAVPGHRAHWAEVAESAVLRHAAGRHVAVAVVNLPWHWDAARRADRRVVDVADHWGRLGRSRRAARIDELNRRIADEADEIIVADEALCAEFPGRAPLVIANCASRDLLDRAWTPAPGSRRLAYLGTVSERLDHDLLAAVLDARPDFSLDIIGPLSFASRGNRPSAEFAAFLERFPGRIHSHGPVPRERVGPVLDAADVLVIPNRRELSHGQSSMKLYDYAAHGRPIVSTLAVPADDPCPHVQVATTAAEFAEAIGEQEDPSHVELRRDWARRNPWEARSPRWLDAVVGAPRARVATGGAR